MPEKIMKGGVPRRDPNSYRSRDYRGLVDKTGLVSTHFRLRETDLHILTDRDVSRLAGELATTFRLQIERYIRSVPDFLSSLVPIGEDQLAPPIIQSMLAAASVSGVGPMAAVAGAIAEFVGKGLLEAGCTEVMVENGGDIFLKRSRDCTIAVFAGQSPLSNRVGLRVACDRMPLGICTSSRTVGHSLSFGNADSVTVLADSAVVADAAATRLGNEVIDGRSANDGINRALDAAAGIGGIRGVLVIRGETVGARGEVELVPVE